MPAQRKASIRELSTAARELDAGVAEGELHRDPETGQWLVGDTRLDAWLERYAGEKVVLIALSLDDERPLPTKVCRTCGADYRGAYCPRCRQARIRLRGY